MGVVSVSNHVYICSSLLGVLPLEKSSALINELMVYIIHMYIYLEVYLHLPMMSTITTEHSQ